MIIYGWREKKISIEPIQNHSCTNCSTENSLFAQVNKSYVHIFWIPFIPLNKKVYSICGNCKQSLTRNEMPPDLQNKAYELKKETKTPWWYFAGLLLVGVLFVLPILSSIIVNLFR